MKIIKIDKNSPKKEDIALIARTLKAGKVVVLPTDTIYGLSCLATSKKGIEKIHKIKRSDPDKPLIILVNSLKMLKQYANISQKQCECLRNFWSPLAREIECKIAREKSKPTTLILEAKDGRLSFASAKQSSIAVRLQKNEINYKIIRELGFPIVSTSLNISGAKSISSLNSIDKVFKVKPDLVVDAGKIENKNPSRLIDIRDINNIKILRN
jgi:L-threonylcarbamoyladenylate synthase